MAAVDGYIPLTDDIVQQLRAHRTRTGIGPAQLLEDADDKPPGLRATDIRSWLAHRNKTAQKDLIDYVMHRWAAIPDRVVVPITPDIRDTLRRETQRTGLTWPDALANRPDIPDGLSAGMIHGWLYGQVKTARREYLEYVLGLLDHLPDKKIEAYVDIPADSRRSLRRERERSGVSIPQLLRGAEDLPGGLTLSVARGIMGNDAVRARPSHVNYLLERYRALPDSRHIALSDDIVQSLRREKQRTGVSIKKLIEHSPALLRDIKPGLVHHWLAGTLATIDQDKLERVLQAWAGLPDDEAR